jgi:putative transposase
MEHREARLQRYQQMMARRTTGSATRATMRATVAKAHAKVVDARRDLLHQESTKLARANDGIVIEDLNGAGMVGNRSLAKAISRTGWAAFRAMLAYKCTRYGRHLIVIDRWYPSSKTCSACGSLLSELSLSTRRWTCPGCGVLHDRDLNAAKNILAAGLAVSACGGGVRRAGQPRRCCL